MNVPISTLLQPNQPEQAAFAGCELCYDQRNGATRFGLFTICIIEFDILAFKEFLS